MSVLAIVLALVDANAGLCAGWLPTAEARMACCENGTCPMRRGGGAQSDRSGSDSARIVTQSQADSCCASSEREESTQPDLTYTIAMTQPAVLGDGVLMPVSIPALVLSDRWRIVSPIPITPVPRHVLLSVFLV